MMKKYHISKKDGEVRECRAKTAETCRAVSKDFPEHFTDKFQAREAVEKHYQEQELLLKTLSKDITAEDANKKENRQKLIPINNGRTFDEVKKEFDELFEKHINHPKMRYYNVPVFRELYENVAMGKIPERVPISFGEDNDDPIVFDIEGILKGKYGYYGRMTKDTAENLVKSCQLKGKTVLDFMAGRGYAVNALRNEGIDVIATDDQSWNSTKSSHVENLDVIEALDKYGPETDYVFMSWSPYKDDIDMKVVNHIKNKHPHLKLIVLGEENGCTNSEQFWKEVEKDTIYANYGQMGLVQDEFFLVE